MKDEESSTDTRETDGLGRIVKSVAAASETPRSQTQNHTGHVKVHVSVRQREQILECGGQQIEVLGEPCWERKTG